jgi:hypothetical protein
MNLNQFLQFTFKDFWHFAGIVILISIPVNATTQILISLINSIFSNKRINDTEDSDI